MATRRKQSDDPLGDILDAAQRDHWTPGTLLRGLIRWKAGELGLELTEEQLDTLVRSGGTGGEGSITVPDEQLRNWRDQSVSDANIKITLADEDVERYLAKISDAVRAASHETTSEMSKVLAEAWLQDADARLKDRSRHTRRVERQIAGTWQEPLRSFELLWDVCVMEGSTFNSQVRPSASQKNDIVFECLARLHARACQVAGEILVLCRHGYADGAMARWRTLHELCVTQQYIAKEGVPIASRFLDHDAVISYLDAKDYAAYAGTLGMEPVSEDELAMLKLDRDAMVKKYGGSFGSRDGWIPSDAKGSKNMLRSVEMSELIPFVNLAHSRVHAGVKSAYFSLAQSPSAPDTMVAGPSVFGLEDALQHAAYTIALCTTTLLLHSPNATRAAIGGGLLVLRDRVFDEIRQVLAILNADDADCIAPTQ